jgi:uncharacterized protein (TIGR00106 family)
MNVMVDVCVVPLGVGVSLSAYIATCQRVIDASELSYEMHPYGTIIEGEWDAVFSTVRACHEAVHEMGAPRINTTIKLGTRTDREQSMQDKMNSVRDKLME